MVAASPEHGTAAQPQQQEQQQRQPSSSNSCNSSSQQEQPGASLVDRQRSAPSTVCATGPGTAGTGPSPNARKRTDLCRFCCRHGSESVASPAQTAACVFASQCSCAWCSWWRCQVSDYNRSTKEEAGIRGSSSVSNQGPLASEECRAASEWLLARWALFVIPHGRAATGGHLR